jgi:hypothetical protein
MSSLRDEIDRLRPLHEAMARFEKGGKQCALDIERLFGVLIEALDALDEREADLDAREDGLDEREEQIEARSRPTNEEFAAAVTAGTAMAGGRTTGPE